MDAHSEDVMMLELCCGCARLTAAFIAKGIRGTGVDHKANRHRPEAPWLTLDLTKAEDQAKILALLAEGTNVVFVWLGIPCGTLSRAREKPLPKHLKRRGVPEPQPLRSEQQPWGLPGLGPRDQERVDTANVLIRFAVQVIIQCHSLGILWALENPRRSLLWWIALIAEILHLDGVFDVDYQACMHGGTRDKWQRLRTNVKGLQQLAVACDGTHVHQTWGSRMVDGQFKGFHTDEEAEYPHEFCRKVAHIVAETLRQQPRGGQQQAPRALAATAQAAAKPPAARPADSHKQALAAQRAAVGTQARGRVLEQLVPEHKAVLRLQCEQEMFDLLREHKGRRVTEKLYLDGTFVDKGCKVLDCQELDTGADGGDSRAKGPGGGGRFVVTIGVPWSCEEFLQSALMVAHPFTWDTAAQDEIKVAIFRILTTGAEAVARDRARWLQKWSRRAEQLEAAEQKLRQHAHKDIARSLEAKRPLLFREMLIEAGFPKAKELSDMLVTGVPMFGEFPSTGVFPEHAHEATKSVDDVFRAAKWSRKALLGSMRSSGNQDMDKAIYAKTLEEVERGMARGPVPEEELSNRFGPLWVPVRRFGVDQADYRAVDDYSEYGHNATSGTCEKLDPGGIDWVAGIAKAWMDAGKHDLVTVRLSSGQVLQGLRHEDFAEGVKLLGRSLDLEKAYKQLARRPSDAPLAIFAVWNPTTGRPELFEAIALGFGARNSVMGFNWFARALLWLMVSQLHIPATHFFDDFPHIEAARSAASGRAAMEALLRLLGWSFKVEGSKAAPFASDMTTLGCVLKLADATHGRVQVANKPERAEKVERQFGQVEKEGILRPAHAASLAGMLQFADAQVFGKAGAVGLRLMRELARGATPATDKKVKACFTFWRQYFQEAVPRQVLATTDDAPLLLFTDGSAEGKDHANVGLGAVLVDRAAQPPLRFISARAAPGVVAAWQEGGQKQIIGQAELFPLLLARQTWRKRLAGRHVICFVDNDSARFVMIKGYSPVLRSMEIIGEIWKLDVASATAPWYERVPSPSNIADWPSRGENRRLLAAGAAQDEIVVSEPWQSRGGVLPW